MLSSYSTVQPAQRHRGGVCRGSLVLKSTTSAYQQQSLYAMSIGVHLRLYESRACYDKGDFPLWDVTLVGSSKVSSSGCELRIVTNQGTQLDVVAPTTACRGVWIAALQAGLTLALESTITTTTTTSGTTASSTTTTTTTTTAILPAPEQILETSSKSSPKRGNSGRNWSLFGRSNSTNHYCRSCGKTFPLHAEKLLPIPLPQYGYEQRVPCCTACRRSQGVWDHVRDRVALHRAAVAEGQAAIAVREKCQSVLAVAGSACSTSDDSDTTSTSSSGNKWVAVNDGAAALAQCVTTLEFQQLLATTGNVEHQQACTDFINGRMGVTEWMELLEQQAGSGSATTLEDMLKTEAFQTAGADMGTAMQLLHEQTSTIATTSHTSTHVLTAVLDFLLEVCANDHQLQSVAFFWPQLCQLHLRMLPPTTAAEAERVELLEHFLLTVATRYSIHLALQLVWSHAADLEESMGTTTTTTSTTTSTNNSTGSTTSSSPSKKTTTNTTADDVDESTTAPPCRFRRFAVLRFVCELESLLFDFEGGWGGGSVAAGPFGLQPTDTQCTLLHAAAAELHSLRPRSVESNQQDKNSPDARLQIAKHADYFSCTLNFSRRLADIAEKLRFMEVKDRAGALEQELNALNASGAMGGDPLNRMAAHLTRVARVPSKEGHVFRSKERTPVLLLMEVIDEGIAERQEIEQAKAATMERRTKEQQQKATAASRKASVENLTSLDGSSESSTAAQDQAIAVAEEDDIVPPSVASEEEDVPLSPSKAPDEATAHKTSALSATLLGADEGLVPQSPGHKALVRFDSDGEMLGNTSSTTPKKDVVKIVNSVATEHLKEIAMPDINETPTEWRDSATGVGEVLSPRTLDEAAESEQIDGDASVPASERDLISEDTSDSDSAHAPTLEPLKDADLTRRGSSNRLVGISRSGSGDIGDSSHSLAPTGDIRRAVLTTIMMQGLQGNTIAAGAADSVQRSLKELERKRATRLLLSDDGCAQDDSVTETVHDTFSEHADESTTNQKIASLGLNSNLEQAEIASRPNEEDEVLEAIRLMLIQNRVAQGQLSPADAAKVLQHTSLNPINGSKESRALGSTPSVDESECPTIDAGDVDSRLVGCGPLPPAVLQAMTLWKGGVVTHAELLELVKKDIEFVKHSVLVDAENLNMLKENSAFWARFAFGERWAEKKARIGSTSPQGTVPGWDMMGVIVKSNDDLRQEAFIMQLIELSKEAFELAGLELWVSPYRILATGRTTGVIECVRNAMSFDALKKRPGYGRGGLREHLQRMAEFTADPGEAFKSAQRNFVRSLAAYSLISFFFLIKDRHNGNLLLDTAGHVIHIDFGFVFGIAPGGSFSLEMSTPFKLTEEMLDVMGGLRSPLFSEFVTLFCCGFLSLQSHCDTFLTLVEMTSKQSTFKCFGGRDTEEIVSRMRERFCPDKSKEDTVSFALDLIKQSTTSYGTKQYDLYQYISQGIVA